ncbi:hypothetical protein ACMAVI_001786 [Burkholderia cenocepacia]
MIASIVLRPSAMLNDSHMNNLRIDLVRGVQGTDRLQRLPLD